jgi:hypothetical protein
MVGNEEFNVVASSTDPNEATKPAETAETDPKDASTKIWIRIHPQMNKLFQQNNHQFPIYWQQCRCCY